MLHAHNTSIPFIIYVLKNIFEIYEKSRNLNLASGGRYDNLMQTLGAKTKVAAIGGAINYDNILKL